MSSDYPILISTCPMFCLADSFALVIMECSRSTAYFHVASFNMPTWSCDGMQFAYAVA